MKEKTQRIMKSKAGIRARFIGEKTIAKSENMTQLGLTGMEWLEPEYDMTGLKNMVEHSAILPQCIAAYSNNTNFDFGQIDHDSSPP